MNNDVNFLNQYLKGKNVDYIYIAQNSKEILKHSGYKYFILLADTQGTFPELSNLNVYILRDDSMFKEQGQQVINYIIEVENIEKEQL